MRRLSAIQKVSSSAIGGYEKNHVQPEYPFGYGLSYTKFKYSDLAVSPGVLFSPWLPFSRDRIEVSFRITNIGLRGGAETAQLYIAPLNPPVTRPAKELKGFTKVYLGPGESKKVRIILDRRSLAYYDVAGHAWEVAPGLYRILVGSSSQDIRLNGALWNLFPASLSVRDSSPVPEQQP
jgi:beta-glucosidase